MARLIVNSVQKKPSPIVSKSIARGVQFREGSKDMMLRDIAIISVLKSVICKLIADFKLSFAYLNENAKVNPEVEKAKKHNILPKLPERLSNAWLRVT